MQHPVKRIIVKTDQFYLLVSTADDHLVFVLQGKTHLPVYSQDNLHLLGIDPQLNNVNTINNNSPVIETVRANRGYNERSIVGLAIGPPAESE